MLTADSATRPTERPSALDGAAQRLTGRIETLVDEVSRLREDNAALRREVREAVSLLDSAGSTVAAARDARRRSAAATDGQRKRRVRGRTAKGRATPAEVTGDVVRAVIVKLGAATASEIAAEINRARAQTATGPRSAAVGGRAVRFLAERAGAVTTVGDDGQRRYRLG